MKVTKFVDDLDHSVELSEDDVVTIRFTINDKRYKLETSKKGEEAFVKALTKFTDAAQDDVWAATRSAATAAARPAPSSEATAWRQRVRAWGRDNGWPKLGDRGRLPEGLPEKYAEANPEDPNPETDSEAAA